MGVPASLVVDMVESMKAAEPLRSLEVEWDLVPLASARNFGLPENWVQRYEQHHPLRRQVLAVSSVVAGSPAAGVLPVRRYPVEHQRRSRQTPSWRRSTHPRAPKWTSTIYRDGEELSADIPTVALQGTGIDDRVVLWAGALLQAPHRAIAVQRGIEAEGGLRLVLQLRFARQPVGAVRRPPHRRRRRPADAGPRRIPGSGVRSRRPRIGTDQHGHLEQRLRGDHAEARQPLLAQLRNCSATATPGNAATWTEPGSASVRIERGESGPQDRAACIRPGPGEPQSCGTGRSAVALNRLQRRRHGTRPVLKIVSGGQTGVDQGGACCGAGLRCRLRRLVPGGAVVGGWGRSPPCIPLSNCRAPATVSARCRTCWIPRRHGDHPRRRTRRRHAADVGVLQSARPSRRAHRLPRP